MNKLKKSLSVLLTLVMLFTTLCFFVIPEAGIEANAASTATYPDNEYYVASGTTFYTEFGIAKRNSSESNAKGDLKDRGYTVLDINLNKGAGGHKIYLGYKTGTSVSSAIRSFGFYNGSNPPETYTYNGALYKRVDKCWSQDSDSSALDLNASASGDYIYMYYSTDPKAGPPITAIDWENSGDSFSGNDTNNVAQTPAVWINSNSSAVAGNMADLNAKAGGDYISFFYHQAATKVSTAAMHTAIDKAAAYINNAEAYVSVESLKTAVNTATTIAADFNADGISQSYDQTAINNATNAINNAIAGLQTTAYFNANGGVLASGTSESVVFTIGGESQATFSKELMNANYQAERAGYRFLGWSTDKNATTAPDSVTVGFNDTVYAIWTMMRYNVVLNPNGADGSAVTKEVLFSDNRVTLDNSFSRTGYTFLGWSESASATTATYSAGQTVSKLSETDGAVINLYAVWKLNTYTVAYSLGGGTMSEAINRGYTITDSFTLPAPTRTGNEFVGWKPSVAGNWGTEILPAGTEISGKYGDVTLTAQWTPTKHTVIWKNYNGDILETDENVSYGSMPFYNGATPTRPADAQYTYSFKEWTPEIDVVTGDVIYTATFESIVNKYTVTWLKEDGTVFEQFKEIEYGAEVPVPSTTPSKPMDAGNVYYFDKWVGYTGEGMKVNGNMSFTASYTSDVRTYTVTWVNYNGDILETDDSVPYNEVPEYNGATPVKEGNAEFSYTFSTWSPELTNVTRDTTYTAQFTESRNNYTVTFRYLTAIGAEETTVEMSVPYGKEFNTLIADLEGFSNYLFNETLHQRFVRWENRTQTITGTATFIAVYEAATAHSCTETNTTTCENDGVKTTTCFCGYVVTEEIKAYNHTLADGTSAWQLTADSPVPTCHAGVTCKYQCSICKEPKYTDVPASGHDFTVIEAVAPSCGKTGNNEYKFCNNCSLYFAADATLYDQNSFDDNEFFMLDALQHDYESEITTDPTCTTAGVRTYTCKHDATHTYTETVNATGHTFVNHVAAKPVSCTVDGALAHKQCSVCNKFFADAEGIYSENAKDDNSSFIIPATGHTKAKEVYENVIDATCSKEGSYDIVVYCTVCTDAEGKPTQISRKTVTTTLPHNKSEIVVPGLTGQLVTAATCTDYAVYKKVCSMCQTVMSDETFSYVDGGKNPANHSSEDTYLVNQTIVTCYADGYTGDEYRSCCDTLIARGSVISKSTVEHTAGTPVDITTKPATCYETGLYDTVTYCSVCSANGHETEISRVSGNTIRKLPHTPAGAVSENVNPATCYSEGSYEEVVYCSVAECREQISRTTKTIEKTEHTPAAAVRDDKTAPTCYSKGSYDMVVYCSVAECQHEISRTSYEIDTLAHTPAAAVRVDKTAPTCYSEGSYDMVVYCSVAECKHEISRTSNSIGKLAHTPAEAVTEVNVAATCYREGSYDLVVYCSVAECHHEISRDEKVSAKLAHTPAEPVRENVIEPTETADGSYEEVIYCSVAACKHEISRTTKATRLERLINFVLKDKVVTITAYNGDTVVAPEVEEYVSAEGFIHVFKSWDKEIVTVNGSATYIAIYTEPCDYTELDRLEVTLNAILEGFYAVEEGILEENWAEINAVLGAIDSINEGRNTRDESEQVAVDLVIDRAEALINTICPDAGSALEIRGTGSYKAGTILDLKVFKMPADTEVTDVIWTTSDSNIVFVVNGILYAVAPGTVTITAVKGNLKAELEIEITLGGGARVIMFDSLIHGANYVVEGSRVLETTTNIFWSPSAPIQFRVIATGVLKEYVVYINDEIAVPDENGTYTIPANTGDAHVRLEGRVPDITDDSDNAEKVSIWELIRRFFQKIADFFKNLFS